MGNLRYGLYAAMLIVMSCGTSPSRESEKTEQTEDAVTALARPGALEQGSFASVLAPDAARPGARPGALPAASQPSIFDDVSDYSVKVPESDDLTGDADEDIEELSVNEPMPGLEGDSAALPEPDVVAALPASALPSQAAALLEGGGNISFMLTDAPLSDEGVEAVFVSIVSVEFLQNGVSADSATALALARKGEGAPKHGGEQSVPDASSDASADVAPFPSEDGSSDASSPPESGRGKSRRWKKGVHYLQDSKQFDLLTLRDGSFAPLAIGDVAAGTYDVVRIEVAEGSSIRIRGRLLPLKIPSGESRGIVIRGPFVVESDKRYSFTFDFDAEASIHLAGATGNYVMKPVIKLAAFNVLVETPVSP